MSAFLNGSIQKKISIGPYNISDDANNALVLSLFAALCETLEGEVKAKRIADTFSLPLSVLPLMDMPL